MKVGLNDTDVVSPYRKMKFTDRLGKVTFHILRYEVHYDTTTEEKEKLDSDPENDDKPNERGNKKRKSVTENKGENSEKINSNNNNISQTQGSGYDNKTVPSKNNTLSSLQQTSSFTSPNQTDHTTSLPIPPQTPLTEQVIPDSISPSPIPETVEIEDSHIILLNLLLKRNQALTHSSNNLPQSY
jgi:hypothetical protein